MPHIVIIVINSKAIIVFIDIRQFNSKEDEEEEDIRQFTLSRYI